MVPKVWPLHHAQSSTPRTRTWGNAGGCAALLTCRIRVSALAGIPSLLIKRWPGRPPRACPHRGDDLAGSLGLLCIWAANLGETFGEDSPLATGVPATPATQTQTGG